MLVNQTICQRIAAEPEVELQAVLFFLLLIMVSICDIKNREIPDGLQAAIAILSLLNFCLWNLAGVLRYHERHNSVP